MTPAHLSKQPVLGRHTSTIVGKGHHASLVEDAQKDKDSDENFIDDSRSDIASDESGSSCTSYSGSDYYDSKSDNSSRMDDSEQYYPSKADKEVYDSQKQTPRKQADEDGDPLAEGFVKPADKGLKAKLKRGAYGKKDKESVNSGEGIPAMAQHFSQTTVGPQLDTPDSKSRQSKAELLDTA